MSGNTFQIINDKDYGFMSQDIEIGINVERIWNESRNENKFVREFSECYQHETIHMEIAKVLFDYFKKEEELLVELMINGNKLPKGIPTRKRSRKLLQRSRLYVRKNCGESQCF